MAAATSDALTIELYGFLADRLASLGRRHGTRILISLPHAQRTVAQTLSLLVAADERYALLFDATTQSLPEHVEVVLNDRVLDLQGGLTAPLKPGDTLAFIPAHAGGQQVT